MEPTIAVDELIIVKAEDGYEVGDIVVYQTGRILVVHRIVAVDSETVTTRGDANNVDDGAIELSQIKGKVIAHIPYVGTIVRLLKTPVATLMLIIAAVLSVALPYRKEKKKKDEALERIKEEIRKLKEEQES
jgi:signal peptidase I